MGLALPLKSCSKHTVHCFPGTAMAAWQTSLHLITAEGWWSPGDMGTLPMPTATQRILAFTCTKDLMTIS